MKWSTNPVGNPTVESPAIAWSTQVSVHQYCEGTACSESFDAIHVIEQLCVQRRAFRTSPDVYTRYAPNTQRVTHPLITTFSARIELFCKVSQIIVVMEIAQRNQILQVFREHALLFAYDSQMHMRLL